VSTGYILSIVACVVFAGLVIRACCVALREDSWLPKELATAKLLFSEQLFKGPSATPVVARVDRAYLVRGQLRLVELKTRRSSKVYQTDVIELSAQRMAVQASTGMAVGSMAHVVIENPYTGRRIVRSVDLLSEDQVVDLLQRRRAILAGSIRPKETTLKNRCARCEYRSECKGEAGARVYPMVRSS
jgi:CRISPR-associated exonuclease Cas4